MARFEGRAYGRGVELRPGRAQACSSAKRTELQRPLSRAREPITRFPPSVTTDRPTPRPDRLAYTHQPRPTGPQMTDSPPLPSYYAQPQQLAHLHSVPAPSGYPAHHRPSSLALDPRSGALSHGHAVDSKPDVGSPAGNGKRRMSSLGEGEDEFSEGEDEDGSQPGGGGGTPGGAPGKKPRKRNRQALSCTVRTRLRLETEYRVLTTTGGQMCRNASGGRSSVTARRRAKRAAAGARRRRATGKQPR